MPKLSERSLDILSSCHDELKQVLMEAIKIYDFTVLEGHRGETAQTIAVESGHSKTPWPESKHNKMPSLAVDIAPYPLDWTDWKRFYYLAGIIMATAAALRIDLRWGGNWDGGDLDHQKFYDLPHFELVSDSPTLTLIKT